MFPRNSGKKVYIKMRVRVTIEVDLETGEYTLQYGSFSTSGEKSVDAKELTGALEKVIAAWKLKFVN